MDPSGRFLRAATFELEALRIHWVQFTCARQHTSANSDRSSNVGIKSNRIEKCNPPKPQKAVQGGMEGCCRSGVWEICSQLFGPIISSSEVQLGLGQKKLNPIITLELRALLSQLVIKDSSRRSKDRFGEHFGPCLSTLTPSRAQIPAKIVLSSRILIHAWC